MMRKGATSYICLGEDETSFVWDVRSVLHDSEVHWFGSVDLVVAPSALSSIERIV